MKKYKVRSNWVALISYTGKELTELCNKLGQCPEIVFSNNPVHMNNPPNLPSQFFFALKKLDFFDMLKDIIPNDALVTCHGFSWIIPDSICNNYEMYNVHPGDICRYPELIGKDPQRKAIKLKLPSTGVVIHRITPDLDQGPIVKYKTFDITEETNTEASLTRSLRDLSIDMWVEFLNEKV